MVRAALAVARAVTPMPLRLGAGAGGVARGTRLQLPPPGAGVLGGPCGTRSGGATEKKKHICVCLDGNMCGVTYRGRTVEGKPTKAGLSGLGWSPSGGAQGPQSV